MSKDHKGIFWKNREGQWIKSTCPRCCKEDVFFVVGPCQGILGHEGPHWCYGPDGSFHQDRDEGDPTAPPEIGYSITPPNHKDYVHPKDMYRLLPRANQVREEVTNPEEIARLNRRDMLPGEGMISPFNLEIFPLEKRKQMEDDLKMNEEDME